MNGTGRYTPTGPRDWRATPTTLVDPMVIILANRQRTLLICQTPIAAAMATTAVAPYRAG